MKPLKNNIHITRIAAQKQTSSGIILKTSEEPDKASVNAIGPDIEEVSVGDTLLVNWNKATKVQDDDYIICIDDVIGVFTE